MMIEAQELTDDIVRDLREVIVSMCARLYGKRSAKNRAQKALEAIHKEPHE
jgi:predicted site-specific integrase-resolvase